MPSIKKRGKSFCIMVSMNYDMAGKTRSRFLTPAPRTDLFAYNEKYNTVFSISPENHTPK